MSGVDYVRFYPRDWRNGTSFLTLEQEGLYTRICAFRWDVGARVPVDRTAACRVLRINRNKYDRILDALIEAGKVVECADGLSVERAEAEYVAAGGVRVDDDKAERPIDQGRAGQAGQDALASTPAHTPDTTQHHTPLVDAEIIEQNQLLFIEEKERKKEGAKAPLSNEDSTPSDECDVIEQSALELEPINDHVSKTDLAIRKQHDQPVYDAFNAYLAMAKRAGLPEPRTMTPQLRKSIGARLRESNIDCWMEAMDNVEGSKFLQGANDRGWCADLTWIVKPANYEKILAGNYINRDTSTEYSYGQPPRKHAILAALDDLRDRFEPIN